MTCNGNIGISGGEERMKSGELVLEKDGSIPSKIENKGEKWVRISCNSFHWNI